MSTKHLLTYDFQDLATVEIDDQPSTITHIRGMVEFWSGWEDEIDEGTDEEYTKVFLQNLALFMLTNRRAPNEDEGWVPFDGSAGILIHKFEVFSFDRDSVEITKA